MQTYITIPEAAVKWGLSAQQVRRSCEKAQIDGVMRLSRLWLIPENAILPPELHYAELHRSMSA